MRNKYIIFVIMMILFCNTVFAVTPPTNKSANGIIEWVDENFTASETFITSGTTQIYTEKSVGIGTTTPDVTKALHVVGDSKFDDTIYVKEGSYNNLSLKSSVQPTTGYYASIYHIGGAVQGVKIFDFQSTGAGFSVPVELSPNTSLSWLYSNVSISGHNSDYTLRFNTDGTEAARFTDNQNFLVGQTVDDGVNKVQVNGDVKVTGGVKIYDGTTGEQEITCVAYGLHFTDRGAKYLLAGRGGLSLPLANSHIQLSAGSMIKLSGGSADWPSVKTAAHSGMWSPTTGFLSFSTDSTVALEIDENQMVEVPHYIRQANSMAMIDMTENTTGQVIPVSTGWTELEFTGGDDHYDVGDCIASSTNNCIQILTTGVYDIRVESSFYCNDRSTQWKFNALVDGTQTHAGFIRFTANSSDVGCAMGSGIIEVTTAPAIITIGVQHNEGSTSTLTCYRTALIVKYLGEIQ